MFSCEFCEISNNTFFTENLWKDIFCRILPNNDILSEILMLLHWILKIFLYFIFLNLFLSTLVLPKLFCHLTAPKQILGCWLPDWVSHRTIATPAGNYLFKINNRNTITRWEIYANLTIKTQERRQWRCSGVFIVNFGHILHLVLVFVLLTWAGDTKVIVNILVRLAVKVRQNQYLFCLFTRQKF